MRRHSDSSYLYSWLDTFCSFLTFDFHRGGVSHEHALSPFFAIFLPKDPLSSARGNLAMLFSSFSVFLNILIST